MKRTTVVFVVFIFFMASCTEFLPTPEPPVYTPLPPTMTPDPCGPESISDEIEMIRGLLNEFHEMAYIATNTPRESLISPIIRLDEIRHDLNSLAVPDCIQDLKTDYTNYTASLLRYFTDLMNKSTANQAEMDLQNSETLWKIVETEFEGVITKARLEFQPLASAESVLLSEVGFKAVAINEGDRTINVREQPDLGARIVSLLEPGVQAIVVGRTESGEWIRVNVLGVYGWVYSDMLTLNENIGQVEIVKPTQ